MRKPIIAGNWKMNKTVDEAVSFVRTVRGGLGAIKNVDSVICPPFVALPAVAEILQATQIGVGAQNIHYKSSGAYTGEVSAEMVAPFCQYVIIGHSERRAHFNERDEDVNMKARIALDFGLIPIICVGESLAQNEAGETESFVGMQVKAAFEGLTGDQASKCIIAYEPIWAIGTGRTADPIDAGRVIGIIVRGAVADLYGEGIANEVRIQYGGSANADNIGDFMAHPDIDGALVGGASLKTAFVDMVRVTSNVRR